MVLTSDYSLDDFLEQEVLMVGIGNHVLRIDTLKVAKGDVISEEEPIKCSLEKPIDGVYIVGRHDGDVTDLSICQWMTSRLASASTDGTVSTFFTLLYEIPD